MEHGSATARLGALAVSFMRRIATASRLGTVLPLDLTVRLYGGTDKLVHGYTEHYRNHLRSRRWSSLRILEIGVGGYESIEPGGSLRVWRDFFPRSRIVGLDISAKRIDLGSRVGFVRGDQTSLPDLDRAIEALGGLPDVVIDDGSHYDGHAIETFRLLIPRLAPGALYFVEDLHTSYWERFGGAIPATDSSAIGLARSLVDEVQSHDSTFERKPHWGPSPFTSPGDIDALYVYPGLFVARRA